MYCRKCGQKLSAADRFCPKCGLRVPVARPKDMNKPKWYYLKAENNIGPLSENDIKKAISDGVIKNTTLVWKAGMSVWTAASQTSLAAYMSADPDNRFAWALASVPIAAGWLLSYWFGWTSTVLVTIILNALFWLLDVRALRKSCFDPDKWLWWGFFLVQVYLFVRASKTDKNYGYVIVWCVLFFLDLFANRIILIL